MDNFVKLAAITILRSEFDVIELFFRINSRVIDSFIVMDTLFHSPPELFNFLKVRDGIDITIFTDYSDTLEDNSLIRKGLLSYLQNNHFDWVFLLSPDQFINIDRNRIEEELSKIPRNNVASLNLSTWIPKNGKYEDCKNPLWSNFQKRNYEFYDRRKIIVPRDLVQGTIPSRIGNVLHPILPDDSIMYSAGNVCKQHLLTCGTIDHVPVRSENQVLIDAIIGTTRLNTKPNRFSYEYPYLDSIAEMIIKYDFKVDDFLLRYLALTYSSNVLDENVRDDVHPTAKLGLETDCIKYGYIEDLNVLKFYHRMCYFITKKLKHK